MRNWRDYYQVWMKRQDEWVHCFSSGNPTEALDYARSHIRHGGIMQRIEVRDAFGTESVETVWDSTWA